jgi:phycobilisome rod-core linker protein
VNNNYRFVEMCIQRVLGREVYDPKEKLAWSIVLATKGIKGFIDSLLGVSEKMVGKLHIFLMKVIGNR